jgi:hypothetical protein
VTAALGRREQQPVQVAVEAHQDEHRQRDRAAEQQDGLDDLDPRRRPHPSHRHIDHHERADPDDGPGPRRLTGAPEQQRHQAARADHLRHQIQDGHGDRGRSRRDPYRPLPHPRRHDVREREPAAVADQFGHEEQHHQPGHEEADDIQQPVVAEQRDESGDPQEGGGGHVVTRDGKTILHG